MSSIGLLSTSKTRTVEYCQWLYREGYKVQTIQSHSRTLRFLDKNCNLEDTESVREFIASRKCSGGRKENLVDVYSKYAKFVGIAFVEPRYAREDTLPFVPLQQEAEALITASRNVRHATLLRVLYETGCRMGEASMLTFRDFDFERRTVRVKPEKGGHARELKLSDRLCSMLKDLFSIHPEKPFPNPKGARKYLEKTRKLLARRQSNPRFLQIHLHTFRHFRATMLYAQTKDILHVKHILGHRSISNTIRYTHMIEYEKDESFITKVAKSLEEFTGLLEQGFEYVADYEGFKVLRKRK